MSPRIFTLPPVPQTLGLPHHIKGLLCNVLAEIEKLGECVSVCVREPEVGFSPVLHPSPQTEGSRYTRGRCIFRKGPRTESRERERTVFSPEWKHLYPEFGELDSARRSHWVRPELWASWVLFYLSQNRLGHRHNYSSLMNNQREDQKGEEHDQSSSW